MTRRYLPTTRVELVRWYDAREVPDTERFFLAPEETDLGEYSALMDAADESAELPGSDGRRMVLVVDTSGVAPGETVSWRFVVALHLDLDAEAAPDDGLAWYATQEIGPLLNR